MNWQRDCIFERRWDPSLTLQDDNLKIPPQCNGESRRCWRLRYLCRDMSREVS
jgi:hypothetical protein